MEFESKEDLAIAVELELWDAEVAERDLHGSVLEFLKQVLVAAVVGLGADWDRRFIARTPALPDRSLLRLRFPAAA